MKAAVAWVVAHKALIAALFLAGYLATTGKVAEAVALVAAALSGGLKDVPQPPAAL